MMRSAWGRNVTGALVAIIIIGPVTYVLTDRSPPADILNVSVAPPKIKGGECGTIYFRAYVRKICPSKIDQRIYTSLDHVWPLRPFESSGPQSTGEQTFAYTFCLPWTIQSATGSFQQRMEFECWPFNSLWPIKKDLPEATFEIEASEAIRRLDLPEKQVTPPIGTVKPYHLDGK
jgi:hypothetical protein